MKKRKTILSIILAASMMAAALVGCGSNDQVEENTAEQVVEQPANEETEVATDEADYGVLTDIAGENGTSYDNLFDVILADDYEAVWYDSVEAIIGEEKAQEYTDMLRGCISADIYGDEAVEAYKDAEGCMFDCYFINGVQKLNFKDDTITISLEDGTEETHTYEYLGKVTVGEGESMVFNGAEYNVDFEVDAYKSTDEAGEFNYFLMRDDTMESTYHIEFRYGKDLEELQEYLYGPYAYWCCAGIDSEADEPTIKNVIDLFVSENVTAE